MKKKVLMIVLVGTMILASSPAKSQWQEMDSPTTELLRGVWGTVSDDVYAVGDAGTILHYDGTEWSIEVSPTDKAIQNIWGSSANDIWAVGSNGAILRYDGTNWEEMSEIPGDQHFHDVWGTSPDNAWAVGESIATGWPNKGIIWHWNGEEWSYSGHFLGPLGATQFDSIWGRGTNEVFVVGHMGYSSGIQGVCYRYDGISWDNPEWSGTGWPLMRAYNDLWGTDNELFIAGDAYPGPPWYAQRAHYDGSSWETEILQDHVSMISVRGSAQDNVYMVGPGGLIIRYDGSTWSTMDSGTTQNLADVWGSGSGEVFAVGNNGTILHLGPPPCTAVSLDSLTADPLVVPLGNPINFEATIADGCGEVDALWDFDDGTSDSQTNVTSPVTTTKNYASVGVYTVVFTVSDDIVDVGDNIIVVVEVPPSEPIEEILDFIKESVTAETLAGVERGKSGKSGLNPLIEMLEKAEILIEAESFAEACQQLLDAYKHTDGESPPEDFVTGEAVSELAERIQNLRESMNCSEYGGIDFIDDMPCPSALDELWFWLNMFEFQNENFEMVADVIKFTGSAADELRTLEEEKHLVMLALFAGLKFDGLITSFLENARNLEDFFDDLAKDKAPEIALEDALDAAGAPGVIVQLTIALFQLLQSYNVADNIANSTGDVYIVLPEYTAYELPTDSGELYHNGVLFATDDFEEETLSELNWLWDVIKYDFFDEKTVNPNGHSLGKANWDPLTEEYEPVPNNWKWSQALYDLKKVIYGVGWGWEAPG